MGGGGGHLDLLQRLNTGRAASTWYSPQIPINMAKNTVPSLSNRWDCWKREYGKVPQRSRRHTGSTCCWLSRTRFTADIRVCYLFHTLTGSESQPRNYCVLSFRSVSYPGWQAGRVEPPERALLITEWTHQDAASNTGVTYFFARGRKKREFEKCASLIRTLHVNTKQCFMKVGHLKAGLCMYRPAIDGDHFIVISKQNLSSFKAKTVMDWVFRCSCYFLLYFVRFMLMVHVTSSPLFCFPSFVIVLISFTRLWLASLCNYVLPLSLFEMKWSTTTYGCSNLASYTLGHMVKQLLGALWWYWPGYVVVIAEHSIGETYDAHDSCEEQHLCVEAEPGEVDPDLFPIVLPASTQSKPHL